MTARCRSMASNVPISKSSCGRHSLGTSDCHRRWCRLPLAPGGFQSAFRSLVPTSETAPRWPLLATSKNCSVATKCHPTSRKRTSRVCGPGQPEQSGAKQVGARDEREEPRDEATRNGLAVSGERRPERSGAIEARVRCRDRTVTRRTRTLGGHPGHCPRHPRLARHHSRGSR